MNHRRVVLGLFVVAGLIVATAGYDVVQTDRSVDVGTASDADAYLAVSLPTTDVTNGETATILRVENQLGREVDVDVTDVTGDTDVIKTQGLDRNTLSVGESADLSAQVTCDTPDQTYTVTVELRAASDDGSLSVRMSRSVSITCSSA